MTTADVLLVAGYATAVPFTVFVPGFLRLWRRRTLEVRPAARGVHVRTHARRLRRLSVRMPDIGRAVATTDASCRWTSRRRPIVAGCQHTGAGTTNVTCATIKFVYLSKKDTPGTIREVALNNAAWISTCGNPPPPPKPATTKAKPKPAPPKKAGQPGL